LRKNSNPYKIFANKIIENKMSQPKVVTIGLGYIGLPTSALIANNNISVHGVDINEKIISKLTKV